MSRYGIGGRHKTVWSITKKIGRYFPENDANPNDRGIGLTGCFFAPDLPRFLLKKNSIDT
jgi:hypothetical protein